MKLTRLTTFAILTIAFGVLLSGCVKKQVAPVNVNQPVNQNINVNQSLNQNTTSATSTADLDTSSWKTYRNDKYGFEFKYPTDLVESKNEYYVAVLSNDSATININILNEKLDPKTVKSIYGFVPQKSLEEVTIAGQTAYRFMDGDGGYGGYNYRIPLKSGHTLVLWFVTNRDYYKDENKIISSFRSW